MRPYLIDDDSWHESILNWRESTKMLTDSIQNLQDLVRQVIDVSCVWNGPVYYMVWNKCKWGRVPSRYALGEEQYKQRYSVDNDTLLTGRIDDTR